MRWKRLSVSIYFLVVVAGFASVASTASLPRLMPVPKSSVFYAPDLPYALFFLNQTWFYRYEGQWYQGRGSRGPWTYLPEKHVPDALKALPPELKEKKQGTPPNFRKSRSRSN